MGEGMCAAAMPPTRLYVNQSRGTGGLGGVSDADVVEEVNEFEILDLDRICSVDSVRILLEYFQERKESTMVLQSKMKCKRLAFSYLSHTIFGSWREGECCLL
jgi:hypothetical protein